jgi:catechol 2,3-dioxygenase-like lactoylglutathione lyase family enzyme
MLTRVHHVGLVVRRLEDGLALWRDRLGLEISAQATVADQGVKADGSLYALEANANPHLARDEDFACAAAAAGRDYPALLDSIVKLGLTYPAQWRVLYGG